MIRSLRRRHLRTFVVLAVVLPVLVVLGLLARQPIPAVDRLPGASADAADRIEPPAEGR